MIHKVNANFFFFVIALWECKRNGFASRKYPLEIPSFRGKEDWCGGLLVITGAGKTMCVCSGKEIESK